MNLKYKAILDPGFQPMELVLRDYEARVSLDRVPRGVDIGFLTQAGGDVCWNALPQDEDWLTRG